MKLTEIRDKVLAEGTADQIALFFQSKGIKGRRRSASSCPLANYIKQELAKEPGVGQCELGVAAGEIHVRTLTKYPNVSRPMSFGPYETVPSFSSFHVVNEVRSVYFTRTELEKFVRNFDAGKYPELETDMYSAIKNSNDLS